MSKLWRTSPGLLGLGNFAAGFVRMLLLDGLLDRLQVLHVNDIGVLQNLSSCSGSSDYVTDWGSLQRVIHILLVVFLGETRKMREIDEVSLVHAKVGHVELELLQMLRFESRHDCFKLKNDGFFQF